MSAIIMDGRSLADHIMEGLKVRSAEIMEKADRPARLHIIRFGEDDASDAYIQQKVKACAKIGVDCKITKLDWEEDSYTIDKIEEVLAYEEYDPSDGVIVQRPIPDWIGDFDEAFDNYQDSDGLKLIHLGMLIRDKECHIAPCTAKGILTLLETYHVPLKGKHAVIVGRSALVGKPTALLLLNKDCTVTICHSQTEDLPSFTKQADILVSATGIPDLITKDMVKPGAAVIDVGITRKDGHLHGDVDFMSVKDVAGWITPVPGGVGPMTVAMLMKNLIDSTGF